MTSSVRKTRSTLVGVGLIALAFLAGVAAGVAATRISARRSTMETRVVSDMSGVLDRLNLSPNQRVAAGAILDRSAPRSREAMVEIAARLRAISDSVDTELRAILTPSQRATLDSLRKRPTFILRTKDSIGATRIDTVVPR